jgi:uncharacterized protein GlcG (DUF336 family)
MLSEHSHTVTLQESESIIAAAKTKAEELGQPMNIAVVDSGGSGEQDQAVAEAGVAVST